MILITYKFVFVLLLCKINAYFYNSDNSDYQKFLHAFNQGYSYQGTFFDKLQKLDDHPEAYKDETPVLPYLNLDPSKENGFTQWEHLEGKENDLKLNVPLKHIEGGELFSGSTILGKLLSSSKKKVDKNCPPLKDDISALFIDTGNLGERNVLTTQSKGETTKLTTQSKCETTKISTCGKSTKLFATCSTIKDISSTLFYKFTCGTSASVNKATTPIVINNSFKHVSQESKIEMVIHVQCDKSEGKTHVIQQMPVFTSPITVQNVYITPNMMTQPHFLAHQNYQMDDPLLYPYQNRVNPVLPQNRQNVLCHPNNVNMLNQIRHNLNSLNNPITSTSEEPAMTKIIVGEVTCEDENLDSELNNQNKTKHPPKKIPQPLLPQDIRHKYTIPYPTIKHTQSTKDNENKPPIFLCQLTNNCRVTPSNKAAPKTKCSTTTACTQPRPRFRTSPKHISKSHFWKHFSLPKLSLLKGGSAKTDQTGISTETVTAKEEVVEVNIAAGRGNTPIVGKNCPIEYSVSETPGTKQEEKDKKSTLASSIVSVDAVSETPEIKQEKDKENKDTKSLGLTGEISSFDGIGEIKSDSTCKTNSPETSSSCDTSSTSETCSSSENTTQGSTCKSNPPETSSSCDTSSTSKTCSSSENTTHGSTCTSNLPESSLSCETTSTSETCSTP